MPTLSFQKYQGAGNDFVLIDGRQPRGLDRRDGATIRRLCDRRFGIGADGLILLEAAEDADFEMVYFNADGREGSLCGNGARCTAAFARYLGIVGGQTRFRASDGLHDARINEAGDWVELRMNDVPALESGEGFYFLDTGSPHYVVFVDDLEAVDVVGRGRQIRYSDRFRAQGTNVNFVQPLGDELAVATYERGVEDETLSCGTGVTAAALAWHRRHPHADGPRTVDVRARGGILQVRYTPAKDGFTDIWLCGPAERVFAGSISL